MISSSSRVLVRYGLPAALCCLIMSGANAEDSPPARTIVGTSTQTIPARSSSPTAPQPVTQATSEGASEAAAQGEPETPEGHASEAPAASEADSSPTVSLQEPAKNLNTVPEDGMGSYAWWTGSTRFVREITKLRPNEDLVICVGGCLQKVGRIVYAQPAEPPAQNPAKGVADAAQPAASSAAAQSAAAPASVAPIATQEPQTAAKTAIAAPRPAIINGAAPAKAAFEELSPAIFASAKATATGMEPAASFSPTMSEPGSSEPSPAKQQDGRLAPQSSAHDGAIKGATLKPSDSIPNAHPPAEAKTE